MRVEGRVATSTAGRMHISRRRYLSARGISAANELASVSAKYSKVSVAKCQEEFGGNLLACLLIMTRACRKGGSKVDKLLRIAVGRCHSIQLPNI